MGDEVKSLIRNDTWKVVTSKSVSGQNVLPGTFSFKYNSKHYCTIIKSKAHYCLREYVQKILSPEPLNTYSQVVQWFTMRLLLIFSVP